MHGCETLLVAMSTTHHECQDRAREQLISACIKIQSHAKQRITTSKVNEASDLSPWLCYGVHAKLQEIYNAMLRLEDLPLKKQEIYNCKRFTSEKTSIGMQLRSFQSFRQMLP